MPDFPSEVESASLALDALDDVEALAAVPEAAGENVVELVFADVSEGGVSEVVARAMASVRSSLRLRARAMVRAIWLTSRVWVRRVT